jgi:hypothetical protein
MLQLPPPSIVVLLLIWPPFISHIRVVPSVFRTSRSVLPSPL